jgi:hypothetical protein
MKTEISAVLNPNDPNLLFSQGNQIFFDSKAFDKMPSHMHQINS